MNTKAQYEIQTARDIMHHQERIQWLESENPCYSCGTPVQPSVRNELLKQSKLVLEKNHAGFNSI